MTASVIDREGNATIAAAEAQGALMVGDTPLAAVKYFEAGRLIASGIRALRKTPDKALAGFLAASQFYHGGHYEKALSLVRKIDVKYLSPTVRPLFTQFFRDVTERATKEYRDAIRREMHAVWLKNDYQYVLSMLRSHPYVFPPGAMAYIRGICCEEIGDNLAAASFFADAIRRNSDEPGVVFTATSLPLRLSQQGKLNEAWQSARLLMKHAPHSSTYAVASLVRYHQASASSGDEHRRYSENQNALYREARSSFVKLPPKLRLDSDLLAQMLLATEAAFFGMLRLKDSAGAKEIADEVIALGGNDFSSLIQQESATPQDSTLRLTPSELEAEFAANLNRIGEKAYRRSRPISDRLVSAAS